MTQFNTKYNINDSNEETSTAPLSVVVELSDIVNTKPEADWTTIDWVTSHKSTCASNRSSLRKSHETYKSVFHKHQNNHHHHHHHHHHQNCENGYKKPTSREQQQQQHKEEQQQEQEEQEEEEQEQTRDGTKTRSHSPEKINCTMETTDSANRQLTRMETQDNNNNNNRNTNNGNFIIDQLIPYGESFLVALLCGLVLGFLGVFTDACSHWVSAFRIGICANFFWLSENACCLGGVDCNEYYTWGEFFLGRGDRVVPFVNVVMYVMLSTLAAVVASIMCKTLAPYAAGGGIAEVKTIVSGHHVRRYLGGWTLFVKTIAMCLSTGSGLVIGKEGPFVHIGACVGGIAASFLPSYRVNEVAKRELITAGAGCGMAVAFGAPVGGVIFALEEVSAMYNFKALMTTLIMGVIAVLLQSHIDLWHTGQIVQFSVNYKHAWHVFELPLFALLGCFGGFIGALFNVVNLRISRWRKVKWNKWRVMEVASLAAITAVVNFIVPYSAGSLLELLGDCFQDCIPGSVIEMCEDNEWNALVNLLLAGSAKLILFIVTVGLFLPAGVLVPSLTIGALYGRAFGIVWREVQEHFSGFSIFMECSDQDLCVIPGLYAIIGAAAVLTGVTRMTICLAIIMFELTGSLDYMVPVIIGIVCAKAASEALGVDGCYEIAIEEAQLPYLDPRKEFHLDYVASDVCAGKQFCVLVSEGLTLSDVNHLIRHVNVKGFPVVESNNDFTLLGYAPTKSIVNAIQEAASLQQIHENVHHVENLHIISNDRNNKSCHANRNEKVLSMNTKIRFKQRSNNGEEHPYVDNITSDNYHCHHHHCHHHHQHEHNYNNSNEEISEIEEVKDELDLSSVVESCMVQVEPSCPVRTLLYLFKSLGTHHVVICEYSKFVGLISKKDLITFMRVKEKEEQMEDAELASKHREHDHDCEMHEMREEHSSEQTVKKNECNSNKSAYFAVK